MKITADTNVLIRAVAQDDPVQSSIAAKALLDAKVVAITLPCLCEFVWVLSSVYRYEVNDIVGAIKALMATSNVEMNRPAVKQGLSVLEAGGDFADGIIAFEGLWLGGKTFVSFDKRAVGLLKKQGRDAVLLDA